MRILIVKTSSMGDVIHTLPAISDARQADPSLRIDWVVEEAFREIPAWHPGVARVIPVAIRRWRRQIRRALADRELGRFRRQLRSEHYDYVIDAQGLVKSGIISRMARGLAVGLSRETIKEPLATVFYNKTYPIAREQHAVQRVRELVARTLGYPLRGTGPDYGLDPERLTAVDDRDEDRPTLVFLHGTSWPNKLWPRPYWRKLTELALAAGYRVTLPWGSEAEHEQALSIADSLPGAQVPDRQSLTGLAAHLGRARGAVAVDTGLGHLAAAVGTPTVSLYGPTDPRYAGTLGPNQRWLTPTIHCAPCQRRRCLYSGEAVHDRIDGHRFAVEPPCFAAHGPESVFATLEALMEDGTGS